MTTIAPANQTLAPGQERSTPLTSASGCNRCGFQGKLWRTYGTCGIKPGDVMCHKCHRQTGSCMGGLVVACPTAADPRQYWGACAGPAEDWARANALPDNF